jgi:hypothetical protein
MDLYSFCMWLGFAGLVAMAGLGAIGGHHSHGHASHGADAHGFHLHGQGHHGGSHEIHIGHHAAPHHGAAHASPSHSSAAHAHHSHHGHEAHAAPSAGLRVLSYLSPRVLFAVALGFGATGLLTAPYIPAEPFHALSAFAGGIGLEKLLISPIWNGLMRFASNPARTLESAVFEEARAITAFDAEGCGLVIIDLDGHEMRVLARLRPEQRQTRVRAGDRLIVEEVDAARGQCRVSLPNFQLPEPINSD